MNEINLDQSVYEIVQSNPEIKEFLIELGFKPLANPAMFNSVARMTTLRKGARLIGLQVEDLIQELEWNGYRVVDREDNVNGKETTTD